MKAKAQISCAVSAQLISTFVFQCIDSTISLLPKSKISSLYLSSVVAQPGLCRTWSEIPKTGFLQRGSYFQIVKYWPEQGKSGFLVWRYMMQRDDPNPAPWSKEGKKKIKELGLTMQYPDGYLEAQAQKEREKEEGEGTPGGKGKKGKGKRKREDEEDEESK